jgi:type VI secretion system VasD/TssJ family lipoprotein
LKISIKGLCLVALIPLLCSCASRAPSPPEWSPEKKAIHLRLVADPQLNLHEGVPHTLLLCIYQLRSPNAFNQLADDIEGIYKLLECSLFDTSVARSKKLIVHPGQESIKDLDRAEGSKYVAVVAGYYLLQKERMVRMFDIPVIEEKKGFIRRKRVIKPGHLNIELTLGPQQIQTIGRE